MNCPNCGALLNLNETDHRHEWIRRYYDCPDCKKEYEQYTVFKCQSHLIQSDTLEEIKSK